MAHQQHTAHLGDATNTEGIRQRFLRAVRHHFRKVRGMIREAVGYDEDRLHLKQDAALTDADDIERFTTDEGKTRAFAKWLRERLDGGILESIERKRVKNGEHPSATYVRASYRRGWENATQRLQNAGVSAEAVEEIFNLGVPQRQLKKLYTRTYENLQSVREDTADAVRDVLTEGLAEGINPRKMATRLTGEVEKMQKTRAEVLARTEVVRSYSESTVSRYERAGIDKVQHGEWKDSNDSRVCPICKQLDGREIPMSEVRTATFTFEPSEDEPDSLAGEYPVMPPAHPSGRCVLLPVIG